MLSKYRRVHFIGIGGIGVSGLAQWFLKQGAAVSGSNLSKEPILEVLRRRGAQIFAGPHRAKHIPPKAELVIYTLAAPHGNEERKTAKKRNIPQMSYPQAIGELTKEKFTIAVCGAHGKSTTASMAALMLVRAGLDPTVILGTRLKEFGNSNFRYGKSKYFVLEADEWRGAFWHYYPDIIIVTNIDKEHLDFYKNIAGVKTGFLRFLQNLNLAVKHTAKHTAKRVAKHTAKQIAKHTDKRIAKQLTEHIAENIAEHTIKHEIKRYHTPKYDSEWRGVIINKDNRWTKEITNKLKSKKAFYNIKNLEANLIRKIIKIPGEHNVSNALAVLALAKYLKIPRRTALEAIGEYRGSWRRFEYKGRLNGAKLYDDYGHHPTEIKATLAASRSITPLGGHLWCVFQPHQGTRLKLLFKDFAAAFGDADRVLILPVYAVAGREKTYGFRANSERLACAVAKNGVAADFAPSFGAAAKILKKELCRRDVCVLMGAGDIVKIHKFLHN